MFSRLALELLDVDSQISTLHAIGVDLEDAIANGFKSIIPNLKILYCIRHLKQRDEAKLDKLLETVKASASSKGKSKSEILKDIYGERTGTTYNYGLPKANDEEDFRAKLD